MKPIIIIPARMDASRFYGKPLKLINNLPMVIKIMKQAEESNIAEVVVATPDEEIAEVVKKYKGNVALTSKQCETGTDRIAEAINILDKNATKYNVIINLQGDLAVFSNSVIVNTLSALNKYPEYDISTPCTLITNKELINNPNTVKAVVSFFENNSNYGRGLYFTRSTCPYGEGELYQHLGIYAYKRNALDKFVSSAKSPLEKRENLEQLRALELGLKIIVAKIDSVPLEVNTKEDLDYILNQVNKNN